MQCSRCGPNWIDDLARCPICGGELAPARNGDDPAVALGGGEIVRGRPDLTSFDPWADSPDGPTLRRVDTPVADRPEPGGRSDDPPPAAAPPVDVGDIEPTDAEAAMLELINRARAAAPEECPGGSPLRWDGGAARAAREHSRDMIDRGFFDHVNPDGDGPGERLIRAGVTARTYGENLAMHSSVESAHRAFMDEPLHQQNHRGNILNAHFTHVGIGVISRPDGLQMITQDFLSRA